jgi:predicted N-acetyltransferase YhbS
MVGIELRRARAEDVPELGRICYEAFKDIADRHGFPTDFQSVEFAQQVVGMLVANEDVYGVGAFEGGLPRGSNFLELWDDVAGIGPVSVDVQSQGGGIGRTTMRHVIDHARSQGFAMVRLCQDSFNMRSLALYASLGFDVKEPLAYLALAGAGRIDAALRPATPDDVPALDELCREIYRVSRRNEIETLIRLGFPAFVIDRGSAIRGYLLGTALGHGVAQTNDDMAALLSGLGASTENAHSLLPMRNGELYRAALAAGHRNQKVMNLMALGPYEDARGTFCTSVLF